MSVDWPTVQLKDITSIIGDGLHGTPLYDNTGEYYFINGNNLIDGKIVLHKKTKRASAEEYLKHKKNLNDRTILISINGTLGNVALYKGEKVFLGKSACYLNINENVDKQFIRYVISSSLFQNYIHSLATGSTIKNVSLKLIREFSFHLPPIKLQQNISAILEHLDNKIELNRETNQTLEHIAQAIFKSWFVDFDPTRAKTAAKQNDQDPERAAMAAISGKTLDELNQLSSEQLEQLKITAALFPDELVDSELGEKPNGWAIGTLDNLCSLNKLSWTKKNTPKEVWYVDLANTKNGVIEDTKHYSWEDAPSRARRVLTSGDTIVGTVRPGNRSFSIIGKMKNQLTASTGFAVLSPLKAELREFVFLAATSDKNIDRLTHLADGGAYPAVRPDVVTSVEVVLPSDKVMVTFNSYTKNLFDIRSKNLESKGSLEELRDTLLPKLLSGELPTKNSEIA